MPYSALSAVERRKPSAFLKSEGSHFTPYSSAMAQPSSFSFAAFLCGLTESVVQKYSHESCFASAAAWRSRPRF